MRLKVLSTNTTAERRYGAWIGGSILASLVISNVFKSQTLFQMNLFFRGLSNRCGSLNRSTKRGANHRSTANVHNFYTFLQFLNILFT